MKQRILNRLKNLYAFFKFLPGYRVIFLLFLFPVFFVLHGCNENFGIIPYPVIVSLLGKYLLITLSIICFNLLWFRSPQKGFVFSFYLLLLFFFFGAVHDTLKSTFPGSRLYSYSVLLPSLLIVTAIVYWLINGRKRTFGNLTRYLVVLSLFFLALELLYLFYYSLTGKAKQNDLAGSFHLEKEVAKPCTGHEYPDIYFIVFDGYSSSSLLKKEFNYANEKLDSMLIRHKYFISAASQSNYNFTAYSLGSTFNLDYFKQGVETGYILPKNVMQAVNTLRNNGLVKFLKEKGYGFRNFGRFEMDYMPSKEVSFFDYFYYDLIDKQTIYARIKRDIGWNIAIRNIFTGKFRIPEWYMKNKKAHLARNENNFQKLLKQLTSTSPVPLFVYTHLMLPHEPFYLRSDGSMASDSAIILNTLDNKAGYIEQVKYSNRLLEKIIELSDKGSTRDKVIIIEGDHGYRFWDRANLQKEFPNLNTYYFSDHDYKMLYNGISPVNTFRVVLNKYFCQNFDLLKDSSVYLKKPGQ